MTSNQTDSTPTEVPTIISWNELTERHDTITTLRATVDDLSATITAQQRQIGEATADVTTQLAVTDLLREQIARHEQWKYDLVADAHAHANYHGYCTDFDDFMQNHDLPRRTRRYKVIRSYSQTETVTQTCYVDAEDEDAAQDLARDEGDWSDSHYGDAEPNDDDEYRVEHAN